MLKNLLLATVAALCGTIIYITAAETMRIAEVANGVESRPTPAVVPQAAESLQVRVASVTGAGATISIPSGSSYTTTTLSTIGTLTVGSGYVTAIHRFSLYCSEDSCTATAASMEQARDLLERIAAHEMKIDVVVDQNCHPKRETIQPRAPELVAAR